MAVIGREIAALRWPALAELASSTPTRSPFVQSLSNQYVPEFGDLASKDARRLTRTVEEVLQGSYVVPLHSTEPGWAKPMLDDGFAWKRWRDPEDGFEPYEDKLAEWGALAPGERSENILFAELRVLPFDRSPQAALFHASQRSRGDGIWGGGSSTGFGAVTLAFDPRAAVDATILPAVRTTPWFGSRPATVEHLPSLLASRIAGQSAFMLDTEVAGLRLAGHMAEANMAIEAAPAAHARLLRLLRAGHDERLAGVRELVMSPNANAYGRTWNPVEAHLRDVAPTDVIRIDIDAPHAHIGRADGTVRRIVSDAKHIDVGGPDPRNQAVIAALNLVQPNTLDDIERSAAARGLTVGGINQQRKMLAAAQASEATYGRFEVARAYDEHDASIPTPEQPTGINFLEDRPEPTAKGTAELRRRMAAARARANAEA